MKKYQALLLFTSIAMLLMSGCRSIDVNKNTAQNREALSQKEEWRHQIPSGDSKPTRPVFPTAQKKVLKNGFTILVVEDHRLPIANVSLVFKNGSAKDPYGHAGLNHLTASMLKEGTIAMTSLGLAEAFANLGTEVSVGVDKDMTQISAAVLSNKVVDAITLIAEMAQQPRMEKDDFSRVKMQHQSLLSSQQGVLSYVAQTNFLRAAYGEKHPYAYPSGGTLETISKINLKDLKKAHLENYGANNAALIAVGDVSMAEIEALAVKNFAHWKKVSSMLAKVSDPAPQKQMQTLLVSRARSPQTYILIGQPVATQMDKDLATLEVFQSILAGLPTSRLDANLREEKGWTYGVGSAVRPLLGKGPMIVKTSVQVPYGADALQEILKEFDRLKREPVSDEELNVAKNGLLHSFGSRYSTIAKIASAVSTQFVYSLPANSEEILYDRIANVSKEDLLAVAKRILNKQHMVAVAVGDLDALENPVAKMDLGKVKIEHEPKPAE